LDKLLAELAKLQSASPLLHLVDWQTKTEQLHTSNDIPSDTALQEIRKPQSMKFLPQSQKTVLCIEDNPSNMNLLEQISKAEGYNLIKAEDGLIALDILKKPIPDIILLDMNLPSIDGYELASYFKADKQLAHIPLIAITGNVLVGDRERCLEAGCDDYLPKPLDIRKMREVLRLYLD
jgi:two-component system cell cycle response regulator DivK